MDKKIIVKNKNNFYKFLKEKLRDYNKNIRKAYLQELVNDSILDLSDGFSHYEISKFKTKTKNPELYYYNISSEIKEVNGCFEIVKMIIEL